MSTKAMLRAIYAILCTCTLYYIKGLYTKEVYKPLAPYMYLYLIHDILLVYR